MSAPAQATGGEEAARAAGRSAVRAFLAQPTTNIRVEWLRSYPSGVSLFDMYNRAYFASRFGSFNAYRGEKIAMNARPADHARTIAIVADARVDFEELLQTDVLPKLGYDWLPNDRIRHLSDGLGRAFEETYTPSATFALRMAILRRVPDAWLRDIIEPHIQQAKRERRQTLDPIGQYGTRGVTSLDELDIAARSIERIHAGRFEPVELPPLEFDGRNIKLRMEVVAQLPPNGMQRRLRCRVRLEFPTRSTWQGVDEFHIGTIAIESGARGVYVAELLNRLSSQTSSLFAATADLRRQIQERMGFDLSGWPPVVLRTMLQRYYLDAQGSAPITIVASGEVGHNGSRDQSRLVEYYKRFGFMPEHRMTRAMTQTATRSGDSYELVAPSVRHVVDALGASGLCTRWYVPLNGTDILRCDPSFPGVNPTTNADAFRVVRAAEGIVPVVLERIGPAAATRKRKEQTMEAASSSSRTEADDADGSKARRLFAQLSLG